MVMLALIRRMPKAPPLILSDLHISVTKCNFEVNIGPELKNLSSVTLGEKVSNVSENVLYINLAPSLLSGRASALKLESPEFQSRQI